MPTPVALILAISLGTAATAAVFHYASRRYGRERFIRRYVFPKAVLEATRKAYPHLAERDLFLVARALRIFFLAHLQCGDRMVGMPSKVVDALWHEFILDTRAYHAFCRQAFGSYFHHVPATAMRPGIGSDKALLRTWRCACVEENIAPQHALRLPLLFAIDAKLRIPDGNTYTLAMRPKKADGSCGGSGCGGFSCGGGCAGGGCGGGCGGG